MNFLKNKAICLCLLFVASLLLKVCFVQIAAGGFNHFPKEGSDVLFYNAAAVNLVEQGVYGHGNTPTVEMPPGQSVFLAILYKIGNRSILFIQIAHIFIMTLAVLLLYLSGLAMKSGQTESFVAAVLLTLDPAQNYLAATFLSEPLYIFLMLLGIYFLLKNQEKYLNWIFAGICFGLAGLTRNQGWVFCLFLMGLSLFSKGKIFKIKTAAIILITAFLIILPWSYRNYKITGKPVLVSLEGGLTLWASNNSDFDWRPPMPMSLPVYRRPNALSQYEIDAFYKKEAVEWILKNPKKFIINGFKKIIVLYHFNPMSWRSEKKTLYQIAGLIPYGITLPFLVLGVCASIKKPSYKIVWLYILFTTLLTFLFYGDSRIRAPIQPYLYLFAAIGIMRAVRFLKSLKMPPHCRFRLP